jgi:hypothetical protein
MSRLAFGFSRFILLTMKGNFYCNYSSSFFHHTKNSTKGNAKLANTNIKQMKPLNPKYPEPNNVWN